MKRPSPAKPRTPGRPASGTGDQREALLDAARLAFARGGYAATSLRQVALEAKVTPALAAYYFGDKAGLLTAVIEQRVAPLVQKIVGALADADSAPLELLRGFMHAYTATAARNPWLPQLVVREVLSEQGVLRETFVERFGGSLGTLLRGTIQRAQAAGALRRDLDPARLAMSLVALSVFPFIATPLVSGVLGIHVGPDHAAALAEHHWSLFLSGAEAAQ